MFHVISMVYMDACVCRVEVLRERDVQETSEGGL